MFGDLESVGQTAGNYASLAVLCLGKGYANGLLETRGDLFGDLRGRSLGLRPPEGTPKGLVLGQREGWHWVPTRLPHPRDEPKAHTLRVVRVPRQLLLERTIFERSADTQADHREYGRKECPS